MNIIEKFKDKKIMTFGQSSFFADEIARVYNKKNFGCGVSFHTQLKSRPLKDKNGEWIKYKSGKRKGQIKNFGLTTLKKKALKSFLDGETNLLATVSALDEGFNCREIELGIITARTSNPNQQIQRGGRIKRILPKDPNAIMLIINIYSKMTKDYDWLRKSQRENKHYVKWTDNINDINFSVYTEDTFQIDFI